MSGLKGQVREPRAGPRARRNADNLSSVTEFTGEGEVIQIGGDGVFTLVLKANGGMNNDGGELEVLTQGVLAIDASGVKLNFSDGLINDGGNLEVGLATDPGLEFSSNLLRAKINPDGTLTRDSDGLGVTHPAGVWSVTDVKTALYTAAIGELVRCDPSGGAFQVDLTTAAGKAGQQVVVKNVTSSTNTITIDANGSETIDGAATATITTGFGVVRLVSDGTNWMIV